MLTKQKQEHTMNSPFAIQFTLNESRLERWHLSGRTVTASVVDCKRLFIKQQMNCFSMLFI